MAIVPLAMAVPGRADSVQFTVTDFSITSGSGGVDGNASAAPADVYQGQPMAGGVLLTGHYPIRPGDRYDVCRSLDGRKKRRPKFWAASNSCVSGGFESLNGNSNVNLGDVLSIAYNNDIEKAFDESSGVDTFGPVTWSLDVAVYNSDTLLNLTTQMASFDVSGSGRPNFAPAVRSAGSRSFQMGGQPVFWTAWFPMSTGTTKPTSI